MTNSPVEVEIAYRNVAASIKHQKETYDMMTNVFSRLLGLDNHEDPTMTEVAPTISPEVEAKAKSTSTVGALAMSLVASSSVKTKLIKDYTTRIAALAEELRQQRASQLALVSGLKAFAVDPALTTEEKAAIQQEIDNHSTSLLDQGVADALKGNLPPVQRPVPMPAAQPLPVPPKLANIPVMPAVPPMAPSPAANEPVTAPVSPAPGVAI